MKNVSLIGALLYVYTVAGSKAASKKGKKD